MENRDSTSFGVKKDSGKVALDLIDPDFLEEFGAVLTKGATKYEPDNWRKGMALGKVLAGVERHVLQLRRGIRLDPEWNYSHAAHAACGLMFADYYMRNGVLVPDDRWSR